MKIAYAFSAQSAKSEAEAEFDTPETIALIGDALRELGHEVVPIDTTRPLVEVVARLDRERPALVFNTAESGPGRAREALYPALFESMGLPYTGSDAYVCMLTLDKHLTKTVLAAHGIPVPRWRFVAPGSALGALDLRLPVIVKPNFEGSSMGITERSVIERNADLEPYLAEALARFPSGLVVEEYIVGRDVVVPYIEGVSPATGGVLEPAEYVYRGGRKYPIFDLAMKLRGFEDVAVRAPAELEPDVRTGLIRTAQRVIGALGVRDLGRSDFRVAPDGCYYFLEMNAIPSLEPGASIYLSGALAGLDRTAAVLGAVIASAVRRYRERGLWHTVGT